MDGEIRYVLKRVYGSAVNLELDFNRLIKWQPYFTENGLKFDFYLFAGAGILNENTTEENLKSGNVRADAGAGVAFKIKTIRTVRNDQPIFHPV